MRPNACGPHLRPNPDAVRCGHAAQHCRSSRGLAGTVHPSVVQSPGAAARTPSLDRVHRGLRPPDRAAPAGRRAADRGARPVARPHDRPGPPGPQRPTRARVRDAVDERHAGRRSAALLRGAGVARLKQAVATSAGGIVIRFVEGDAAAGRRQAEARARRRDLDPPQGHAQPPRDDRGDRDPRGARGERPRRPDRPPVRLHRVLVRPGPDPDPQDRPLLPHDPDRRRPRPPRPRVRRGALDRLRRGAVPADVRDGARARRPRGRRRDGRHVPGRAWTGRGARHDRARADRPDADARCSTATRRWARRSSSSRAG